MKTRLLLLLIVFGWMQTAPADDGFKLSGAPLKLAVQAVIKGQLAAFREDRFDVAYGFAARKIHDQFPLDLFERMVRMGYPAIAKSASASFGLIFDNGDEARVDVAVVSETGQTFHYRYFLERVGEDWRITGVTDAEANLEI